MTTLTPNHPAEHDAQASPRAVDEARARLEAALSAAGQPASPFAAASLEGLRARLRALEMRATRSYRITRRNVVHVESCPTLRGKGSTLLIPGLAGAPSAATAEPEALQGAGLDPLKITCCQRCL